MSADSEDTPPPAYEGSIAGGDGVSPKTGMEDVPAWGKQLMHEIHGLQELKHKVHELEQWRQSQPSPTSVAQPPAMEIAVHAAEGEGLGAPKVQQEGTGTAVTREADEDAYQEPGDRTLELQESLYLLDHSTRISARSLNECLNTGGMLRFSLA